MSDIAERYRAIAARVEEAATASGRRAGEIVIVAVSKKFGPVPIGEALAAGATDLGENRAQELKEKVAAVGPGPRWHFVGPLQTNKARHVVGVAVLVHSVDRMVVAEEIGRRALARGIVQDVLLEVNVSGERSKHGVSPDEVTVAGKAVDDVDGVSLKGLMTMAPLSDDPERSRPFFKELARLRDELMQVVSGATSLSMGMTRDFEVAIQEGATLVRIGEAIFGPRPVV